MSARDDASTPRHSTRRRTSTLTLALAALAGAAVGAVFALSAAPQDTALFETRVPWHGTAPAAAAWPDGRHAGESADVRHIGRWDWLVVRAPRAPRVARCAQAFLVAEMGGARAARLTPRVEPIVSAWRTWLGGGALLGALAAMLAAGLGLWLRRFRGAGAPVVVPASDPGSPERWLHVVAGPSPLAIARGVTELAAHALARGERVLVVDGSARLRLHERFGREARWGLMECLLADMPVLGLVQYGGRPSFYLLAHGKAGRGDGWAALGQRLDEARPHFGRVILALDVAAPGAVGDSLRGRAVEGWWAEPLARLPRHAQELADRLGIALSNMDLTDMPEASLELLSGRARALAAMVSTVETVGEPVLQPPAPGPVVEAPPEPIVLDCDLQVRQRLRFLAWMRRVQSERRRLEVGAAV